MEQDMSDEDFLRLPGAEPMDVGVSWHGVGELEFQGRSATDASDGMSTVPGSPERDRDGEGAAKERRESTSSSLQLPTDKFLSILDHRGFGASGFGVKLEPREARLTSVGSDRDLEAGFEFGFFPSERAHPAAVQIPTFSQGSVSHLPPLEIDSFRSSSPHGHERSAGAAGPAASSAGGRPRSGSGPGPASGPAGPLAYSSLPASPAESPPVPSPHACGIKQERAAASSPRLGLLSLQLPPGETLPNLKRRRSVDSNAGSVSSPRISASGRANAGGGGGGGAGAGREGAGSEEEEEEDEDTGADAEEGSDEQEPDSPGGEGAWGSASCKEKKVPFEQLLPLMGRSLAQAAKALNMCPTTLKKICRRYGISRWPSRKLHRIAREAKLDTEGLLKSGGWLARTALTRGIAPRRLETLLVESGIRKVNSIAFTRKDLMPKRMMASQQQQQQQPWTTQAHQASQQAAQQAASGPKGHPPTRSATAAAAAGAAAAGTSPELRGQQGPSPRQGPVPTAAAGAVSVVPLKSGSPASWPPPRRRRRARGPARSPRRRARHRLFRRRGAHSAHRPTVPAAASPPAAALPRRPSACPPPPRPEEGGAAGSHSSPPPSLMDEEEEQDASGTVVSVKVTFGCCGEIMRFRACPQRTTLGQVERRVAEGCSRLAACPRPHAYKLRFTDEDGDQVILNRPADLQEMFSIATAHMGRKALIKALPSFNSADAPAQPTSASNPAPNAAPAGTWC
eukprot:tig00021168_g19071.t1